MRSRGRRVRRPTSQMILARLAARIESGVIDLNIAADNAIYDGKPGLAPDAAIAALDEMAGRIEKLTHMFENPAATAQLWNRYRQQARRNKPRAKQKHGAQQEKA